MRLLCPSQKMQTPESLKNPNMTRTKHPKTKDTPQHCAKKGNMEMKTFRSPRLTQQLASFLRFDPNRCISWKQVPYSFINYSVDLKISTKS